MSGKALKNSSRYFGAGAPLLVALMIATSQILVRGAESSQIPDRKSGATKPSGGLTPEGLRSLLRKADLKFISYIFGQSKKITVVRGRTGQLRILMGDVSDELLSTKIRLVRFSPTERYNVNDAKVPVLESKEVQTKMRKLGIEEPVTVSPGFRREPDPQYPHLPKSITNVRMDEALDRVGETFGRVMIYGQFVSAGHLYFAVASVSLEYLRSLKNK